MGFEHTTQYLSYAVVNVSSLAKRLELLTQWNAGLLLLSEVRASKAQQRSISRRAKALHYSCIHSAPPPASSTFEVSPGGVSILSRSEFAIRVIRDPVLDKWSSIGRCVAAQFLSKSWTMVCCVVYGFSKVHPQRHQNEILAAEVFHWAAGLTLPVLIGGDFNESLKSSTALSLAESWGLFQISGSMPTTLNKAHRLASTDAIDHVFVNARMRDCSISAAVDTARWVSDHYPIVGSIALPSPSVQVMHWPSPVTLPPEKACHPEWRFVGKTFAEWSNCAERWLAAAFLVTIPSKSSVSSEPLSVGQMRVDKQYRALLALQGLIKHIEERGSCPHLLHVLKKKLFAVGVELGDLSVARESVHHLMNEILNKRQAEAIKDWKGRVMGWNLSSKDLYRYIRNLPPAKPACIMSDQGPTSDPCRMARTLDDFWTVIESWPDQSMRDIAIELVEDKYGAYIPCSLCDLPLSPNHLFLTVKHAKASSPGLDGWSLRELKQLPLEAWESLIPILRSGPRVFADTFLGLVRRLPLEKADVPFPSPGDIRPIDIFSQITRCVASAQMNLLIAWKRDIVHPCQYATHGGTLRPISRYTCAAEKIRLGLEPIWALSVDFEKLFNRVCPRVVVRIAELAGLSREDAEWIALPLIHSRYIWRLPFGASCPETTSDRGIPQGLSSSVTWAELFLSLLVRRLSFIQGLEVIAYVDDISVLTPSEPSLIRALELVREFEADFAVPVSLSKSALWGSDVAGLSKISAWSGIPVTNVICALGMEWALKGTPKYVKERQRLAEARERLARVAMLALPVHKVYGTIGTACLSLSDFSALPSLAEQSSLALPIKKSLGAPTGAPEILLNIGGGSSVDPIIRWIVTACRVWHDMSRMADAKAVLARVLPSARNSRMSLLVRCLRKREFDLDGDFLYTPFRTIDLKRTWPDLKSHLVHDLKRKAWCDLEKRRPNLYGSLDLVDVRAHTRLMKSLDSYRCRVMLRIWSGCPMTLSHRHTLDPSINPMCHCGGGRQDMHHLVFCCPAVPPPSPLVASLSSFPPVLSSAFVLPFGLSLRTLEAWKAACLRAIQVLTVLAPHVSSSMPIPKPSRGHIPAADFTGEFVYCTLCHVTRKCADSHFLCTRQCKGRWPVPVCLGDYVFEKGHLLRLEMTVWKRSSRRPQLRCVFCGFQGWATSLITGTCPGE